MNLYWLRDKGFTLLEMLLVLVVISIIFASGTMYVSRKAENVRIDRTALQIQFIFNAALAYHIANGQWPGLPGQFEDTNSSAGSSLMPTYLPAQQILNSWGVPYQLAYFPDRQYCVGGTCVPMNSYVVQMSIFSQNPLSPYTQAEEQAIAQQIASRVPHGFIFNLLSNGWTLVAYVDPPGQGLNNAIAVNFAGIYHHGACVPVPQCPQLPSGVQMQPQIFVMPVSVSGVSDINVGVPASNSQNLSYPISSFTAFASGPAAANPVACPNGTAPDCDVGLVGPAPPSGEYWRVCMQVVTNRGDVSQLRQDQWGSMVSMSAFTRCAEPNEPAGSTFAVFTH